MSKPNEKPNAADKQASQPPSKTDVDKKEETSVVPLIEKKVVEEKSPRQIALEEFRDTISALEKGVNTKDNLFLSRAVSRMNPLRNKVKIELFLAVVDEHLLPANATSQWIHALLKGVKDPEPPAAPVAMDTDKPEPSSGTPAPKKPAEASLVKSVPAPLDESPPASKPVDSAATAAGGAAAAPVAPPAPKPPVPKAEALPEVELYLRLFAVLLIIDRGHKDPAAAATAELVKILTGINRRTIDLIAARVYQYYALTWELIDKLADIRNTLLTAHRTACLHHDEPSQVTLTNAILRNYLHYNLYSQADKFRLNSKLPDSRSTSQHARYLFYLGIINSIQLHYGDAYGNLSQAIRKAPQKGAIGFRQAAHKWSVVVQLLMGEVPERGVFRQAALQRSLRPYFQITQAVRVGNLALFHQVMTKHRAVFLKDKTLTLIDRLRHNVIKTGLRNINLSYSRISLKEICAKLHLESEVDAEYIVAKAIHDGVIDATIDHDNKAVFSKENIDIYSTTEPQAAFHRRIQLCTDIQHGAVKSLRFPPNVEKPKVIAAGGGSSEEDAYED